MSSGTFAPYKLTTLVKNHAQDEVTEPQRSTSTIFTRTGKGANQAASGSSTPTAPGSPKLNSTAITALELCDSHLYIGTSDGHLHHHTLSRDVVDADTPVVGSLNAKVHLALGRRHVDAILAVPTESKLVIQCDASAHFFELDSLTSVSNLIAQPVKAITCFGADREIQSPMPLAFAKRRSLLLSYLGDMLENEREIPLPDGAQILVRHGNRIMAADQQQYKLINLETREITPLFPYDRALQSPLVAAVNGGEFLLATPTPQGLGLGLFISANGEPVRGTLEWRAIPKSLAFQFPYVVALLKNNTIEVHNSINQQRIQSISLPAAFHPQFIAEATFEMELPSDPYNSSSSIRLLVGCKDRVLALRMVSLTEQVEQLFNLQFVERALALAKQLRNQEYNDTDKKEEEMIKLYRRGAIIQFKNTLFQEAFSLMHKAHVSPIDLLPLFPDLVKGAPIESSTNDSFVEPKATVETLMTEDPSKDELKAPLAPDNSLEPKATIECTEPNATSDVPEGPTETTGDIDEPAKADIPPKESEVQSVQVPQLVGNQRSDLLLQLGTIRQIVDDSLSRDYPDADSETLESFRGALIGNAQETFAKYIQSHRDHLAVAEQQLLDMVLLKIFAGTDRVLFYKMLQSDNALPLEEAEEFLESAKMFYALSILYERHGLLEKSLSLNIGMASKRLEDPDFPGSSLLLEKISRISDPSMVVEYGKDILQFDFELGLKVFTTNASLEEGDVLRELESVDPKAYQQYIQHLIDHGDQSEETHTKLAMSFINEIAIEANQAALDEAEQDYLELEPRPTFPTFLSRRADQLSQTHFHLLKFLSTSIHYSVSSISTRLQHTSLHSARAILLGRANDHIGALEAFLALKDGSSAEEYCLRAVGNDTSGNTSSIPQTERESLRQRLLFILFKMYLAGKMLPTAVRLLTRHSADFDILEVLAIIPDDWSVGALSGYLTSSMRKSLHVHREVQIIRAVSRAHHIKVQSRTNQTMQRFPPVVITENGLPCTTCGKIVNDPTVFVRSANGRVMHLHCHSGANKEI
ncbi:vacuolar sorting protein 39 domain 2-domain-containing protein [Phlyctochytrium arcticum]|nr:vacuolar sorting protein 39 domain 2-domain-containing protein [Phlyctochytrium arcticum]